MLNKLNGLPPSDKLKVREHDFFYPIIYPLGGIIFWILRVHYWDITFELPFSDMLGLENVAHRILAEWNFQWDEFWVTYNVPTLVLLRAGQIFLFGESLTAWRFFQAMLTFLSLIWLIIELVKVIGRQWLGAVLLWEVALSKSSIFWSLKLAREGAAETFIYLCSAIALFAIRKENPLPFFLAGIIFMAATFNRVNFFFAIPVFITGLSLYWLMYIRKKPAYLPGRKISSLLLWEGMFLLGVLVIWLPWLVRSYSFYSHIVPFSTQGPYSFLWELGPITITDEKGQKITKDVKQLQLEAPQKFQNDYEASQYANKFVRQWLQEHWQEYPALVLARIQRQIFDRTIFLTKVSRLELFGNFLDKLLLDKTPPIFLLGTAGLLLLSVRFPCLFVIPVVNLIPSLSAAFFLGEPRMLEPALPISLFGNILWVLWILRRKVIQQHLQYHNQLYEKLCITGSFVFVFVMFWGIILTPLPQSASHPLDESKEFILNGSFSKWSDTTPTDWILGGNGVGRVYRETQVVKSGQLGVKMIQELGEEIALYQDITIEYRQLRGREFAFGVWVKSPYPNANYLAVADGNKWITSAGNTKINEWEYLVAQGRFIETPTALRVHLYIKEQNVPVYYDEASFRIGAGVKELLANAEPPSGLWPGEVGSK